jgi:Domain of unknown function (DUF5916)/Carbohydrate family 9 binding domain-like
MPSRLACLLAFALLAPPAVSAQELASTPRSANTAVPAEASATTTIALRAEKPPVLDGRGDDPAWRAAQVITRFRTFDPVEDGDPRFRTEARIMYDDHNLYVLVRAFDPHPDSIVSLLSRRDARTQSDQIKILLDPYHDRRTGVEFAVNPAGVKRDIALTNDSDEDNSWDAVWDVATRIDSLGWIAEFRIPLSQLRYPAAATHTFGVMINRDVARFNERLAWPVFRRTQGGIASQFGEVTGIEGIASPRRLEVAPYSVAKSYNAPRASTGFVQKGDATVGADVKYGITSNLTIDATVNPDFGQVEADPSVLNLSAFETFFPEKRPFFLEGQGLFRFDVNCNDGSCSGLFYSRRIGRGPQLSGTYDDVTNPTSSTIIGAAKLTGRLSHGTSIGILDAVTQREIAPGDRTIEPRTNYLVGRAQQDFRQGASSIGAMFTDVHRDLDAWSDQFLRSDALSGGADFRHQFLDRNFEIAGYYAQSLVRGSAASIAATQRSFVHNYQRPDDGIALDTMLTTLGGYSAQLSVSKRGGGRTRGNAGVQFLSPGFEINDVGFLSRANAKNQWAWFQYQDNRPRGFYRSWNVNFNQWSNYTWNDTRTDVGGNVNTHWQFKNTMWLHAGQGLNSALASYCDNCLRGGPAVRRDPSYWGWAEIEGDPRRAVTPYLGVNWNGGDGGRSHGLSVSPGMDFRVTSRVTGSISYDHGHDVSATQFNGNYGVVGVDTTHYTVASLDQKTRAMTLRLGVTATPGLSLQVYAQPFATHGAFTDWLQVIDPRAEQWTSRYGRYDGDPGAFDFKQYRSNTVLRWEYRPGSTLFLVWAQERTQDLGGDEARAAPAGLGRLAKAHPNNVFLIKGSYWVSF